MQYQLHEHKLLRLKFLILIKEYKYLFIHLLICLYLN